MFWDVIFDAGWKAGFIHSFSQLTTFCFCFCVTHARLFLFCFQLLMLLLLLLDDDLMIVLGGIRSTKDSFWAKPTPLRERKPRVRTFYAQNSQRKEVQWPGKLTEKGDFNTPKIDPCDNGINESIQHMDTSWINEYIMNAWFNELLNRITKLFSSCI